MAKDDNESRKLTITALIVSIVCPLLLLATLFFPEVLERNISKELEGMTTLLGDQQVHDMYSDALGMSDSILVDTGFIDKVREVLLPHEYLNGEVIDEDLVLNTKFWGAIDKAIYGFALNIDLALLRLLTLKVWLALMLVFTAASISSGYWIREIKKHGFEYSSPMRHGIGRRVMYTLPLIAMLYLVVPFALPVYCVPIAILLYSLSIMIIVANTIKRV